jgi:hypothetical protein
MRLEKLVRAILSKIQENFCKGLDFEIRTQVCSYIQVQRLQKPFFVISNSNLSIPFFLISYNQFNGFFFFFFFFFFSEETIFRTGGILNQEAASYHNQIRFGTLIQEIAS